MLLLFCASARRARRRSRVLITFPGEPDAFAHGEGVPSGFAFAERGGNQPVEAGGWRPEVQTGVKALPRGVIAGEASVAKLGFKLADIKILQDPKRIRAVIKDGKVEFRR